MASPNGADVESVVDEVEQRLGRLGFFVNAAGVLRLGEVRNLSDDQGVLPVAEVLRWLPDLPIELASGHFDVDDDTSPLFPPFAGSMLARHRGEPKLVQRERERGL